MLFADGFPKLFPAMYVTCMGRAPHPAAPLQSLPLHAATHLLSSQICPFGRRLWVCLPGLETCCMEEVCTENGGRT